MIQQTNAVLNALEQGKVEACIRYIEVTHPDYLVESAQAMLELIGMPQDSIEHWIEYFKKKYESKRIN